MRKAHRPRIILSLGLAGLVVAGLTAPSSAHASADTGSVHGYVTGASGEPIQTPITVWTVNMTQAFNSSSGPDGSFSASGLPDATYTIAITPPDAYDSAGTYPQQFLGGVGDRTKAQTFTVTAGADVRQDVKLVEGVHFTGSIIVDPAVDGSMLGKLNASAMPGGTSDYFDSNARPVLISGSQYRSAPFLPTSDDVITFDAGPDWLKASYTVNAGTPGADIPLNVHLSASGWITGTMTKDADTPGYPAVLVTQSVKPSLIASYLVDVDQNTGHFTVKGLPTGSYDVDFVDAGGDTFPEYWQSSPTRAGATAVVVTAGAATTIAPVLHVGARVTGTIRYESSTGSQMPTSAGVSQYSRAADGSLTQAPNTWVWAYGDGGWISEWVLPPGSYSWGFSPAPINGDYDFPPQYFGGRTAAAAADVPAPLGMSSVPMVLQPATFTSSRISGASRYETAATIADAVISVGTHPDVVYLASGENFPDSLSAGAAAAHDRTVVLTTTRDALPASIAAELDRLQPHEIRIVGGTAAISDDVTEQIQTKVPTASVTRIAGADRYETSRLVAQTAFSTGATTAFVATGRNYPDALAAGGAAAKVGGPVLLVDGDASTADSPTIALLTDLGVKTVDIAGGTAAVTSGLEASLDTHFAIGRLAGADRYATAAEINRGAFYDRIAPSTLPPRSVVVTGTVFADAVVAAPLAAVLGAPIELSMPGCIPEASMSSIVQLGATDMTLLGGTTALGADVAAAHACSGPYSTGSLDLTQLPH